MREDMADEASSNARAARALANHAGARRRARGLYAQPLRDVRAAKRSSLVIDVARALHLASRMMKLDLSTDDARFLGAQLARHASEIEDELVHTDERGLQHALAADLERLRRIQGRITALLDAEDAIG